MLDVIACHKRVTKLSYPTAMNILVLCADNSARSILLEAILNEHSEGRVRAFSAGSRPADHVHPQSLVHLNALDYDTSRARSKSCDEFATYDAPIIDIVISVCGTTTNNTHPTWPGDPVQAYWDVADPTAATQPEWPAAFADAYDILQRRADAFLKHPIETMDPGALHAHLNRVGQLL